MSEPEEASDDAHTITLGQDGVTVEKRLAPDEFDTPAVVFTIRSDRDAPAYVRITDPLPESIDPDDVGLHPEYDSEGWRRRGGDLQFEGRLDPGQQLETVYGLRVAEVERPSALLAEPRIDELVDADVVGDAAVSEPEPGTAVATDMSTGGDDGDDADEESVAAALAAELEAGEVDAATKATLSEHLEARLSNSSDVRLDSVQARLSDLEAYTDALERILDRIGTDDDALADLSELRGEVEDLGDRLDDAADRLDDAVERTDELEATTADAEAAVDDLRATADDLESEVATVRDRLDAVEDLPETVGAVESDLADLREELREFRETTTDELEGLRADVSELQTWRENLATSIAGAMGGAGGAGSATGDEGDGDGDGGD